MRILIKSTFLIIPVLLSGCEKNENLSPPENSESVSIAVKLPIDMDVLPLRVMYRSNVCHKKRSNANGERYEEPGYHLTELSLKQEGNSDIYTLPVPFEGGGWCHWKLSNVTLDIKYKIAVFPDNIDHVVGTGIIIIFDDNSPQRDDGIYEEKIGDLIIEKNYFPWINENFLNGKSKDIWTFGEKLYFNYKVKNTYKILFKPLPNTKLITYSIGPKIKMKDNHTQFTYPDGTVVTDGSSFPDYKKLQSLINEHN